VILTFPIGALCGLLVGRLESRQVRVAVVFVMLMPMLGSFVSVVHLPNRTVNERISGEQRSYRAMAAGEWLDAHRRPGDSLYVLCASANLYAYAEMDPTYRYLWFDGVHQGRNSQEDLAALLTGGDPPTWVAAVDLVEACTESKAVADALTNRYHPVETIDGITMLVRNDG
jgi:hypothetical protein